MQPLFSQAEIMFINPDLPTESGHYVLIESEDGGSEEGLSYSNSRRSAGNRFFIRSIGGMTIVR